MDDLIAELIDLPEAEWPGWLTTHASRLSLETVARLKQRSDQFIKSDSARADRISRAAIAVAEQLPTEPIARALAYWARGNWAVYRRPEEAVDLYQKALVVYEQIGDSEAIARLSSNLIFACTTLGRFADALAFAERAQRLLEEIAAGPVIYRVNFGMNYGLLLYECGHYQEALDVNEKMIALARDHGLQEEWAELQVNQAFTMAAMGRLAECEQLLIDSRQRLEQLTPKPVLTIARIDLNLGDYYSATANLSAALNHFRDASKGFQEENVAMDYATVLLYEANLLKRLGALREARRAYDRAYQAFREYNLTQYAAQALLAGAAVRREINPADPELPEMLNRACDMFTNLQLPIWRNETLLEQARLAFLLGNYAQAEALLTTAWSADTVLHLTIAHQLLWGRLRMAQGDEAGALTAFTSALTQSQNGAHIWSEREALVALGNLLAARQPDSAIQYLQDAVRIDELMRAELSVAELTADFQSRRNDALPLLAKLERQTGHLQTALQTVWRWKGGALIDLIRRHDGYTDVNPTIAQLQQRIAVLRWELERKQRDDESEERLDELRRQIRDLEAQAYHERRYHIHKPGQSDASIYNWQAVLSKLDADCLVEYVSIDDELYAWCITRNGDCTVTTLGSTSTISELLQRLELKNLNALRLNDEQRQQRGETLIRDARVLLQRLYRTLIEPLPIPVEGKLLIAPCAPIHLAPFAALWDGNNYLMERYLIEQIPTGALLGISVPAGPSGPALVIGASADGMLAAVQREINAIAGILPDAQVYLDDPAALTALHNLTTAPRILHFSAHTTFDEEPTIFAGLHLADRTFTIEECYRLNLAGTELVTLNGCTTAYGMESGGALIAFQSAFLIAGAQRLLVSLWPIKDEPAAGLMAHFYQNLMQTQSPAVALRQTQRDLLHDPALAHPAIWSAFAVMRR
ncbi:MAG: CHAT domain-containing protein [Chloroflexus sp.]|jgi:CHAT domain-containing protein|uniref:CHAT domain-containing tetratricopeptide repeat protein n=2 Tax=Chloroflexus sp. TaxID=1904827 RepID=UPI000F1985A2|nr:MAG: CHAT domain-containing protein [Chloroflexota bacterium]